MIPGIYCDVDEICALVGYFTASCGNCLPTLQDNVLVLSSRVKKSKEKINFLTFEDGTDMLSQNISKKLPHDAA
jgi:hypothetical protein